MTRVSSLRSFNRILTACTYGVLFFLCMGWMLYAAAHKTIVIEEALAGRVGNSTSRTERVELPIADAGTSEGMLSIPVQASVKAERVTVDNRYMSQEICVTIDGGDMDFYRSLTVNGDNSQVRGVSCEPYEDGVLLTLSTNGVLECRSTLENETMVFSFSVPSEVYDLIVVIDPAGGGTESGVSYGGCREKEISLAVAKQVGEILTEEGIKLYLTRTEDSFVEHEERMRLAEQVDADIFLEIGLSEDADEAQTYGISAYYNDRYFLPDFGNVEWADALVRNVTIASSNRARGLYPAQESSLDGLSMPSARLDMGYVTNADERELLLQENYQKKLAQGIADAILEVYTNANVKNEVAK